MDVFIKTIGPDGDKLLKHFNDFGKAEGRKAN